MKFIGKFIATIKATWTSASSFNSAVTMIFSQLWLQRHSCTESFIHWASWMRLQFKAKWSHQHINHSRSLRDWDLQKQDKQPLSNRLMSICSLRVWHWLLSNRTPMMTNMTRKMINQMTLTKKRHIRAIIKCRKMSMSSHQ